MPGVDGAPDSFVYLALSPLGSNGYVQLGGSTYNISARLNGQRGGSDTEGSGGKKLAARGHFGITLASPASVKSTHCPGPSPGWPPPTHRR